MIWIQLKNRWKKNGWIALELLLVFCLVWYMTDYFFVLAYNRSLPSSRDTENTYLLSIGTYSKKNQAYSPEAAGPEEALANFRRIINRLKEHPDIESVAVATSDYSFPGTGSFSGSTYRSTADTARLASLQFANIYTGEDYLRAFRHTTDNGRRQASVADYDWGDPSNVLITRMAAERLFPGTSAIGKTIESNYKHPDHPRKQFRVAGVLDDVKRYNYLRPYGMMFIPERLTEENFRDMRIGFRLKRDIPSAQFANTFRKEMSSPLQTGNFYLKDIRYIPRVEADTNRDVTTNVRTRAALMAFFFLSIFLCVLGTFWYRVNTRREEIGIRRAMGSGKGGIRNLFIMEGLMLLAIVALPAMLIEVQFVYAGLIDTMGRDERSYGDYLPDHTVARFLLTNAITFLLMAAIVIPAILHPAHSASRLEPVEALRDE